MSSHYDAILDHEVISERYFFPRVAPVENPVVVEVDGAELHCYRSAPHADAPTVLHFHGNGEVVADWMHDFAPALNARGLNVFLAEFRGYGGSTGKPALARMLADSLVIADATGVSPDQLIVYGRSVGSIYALHVAANRPVAGVIIESGIADVFQRLELRMSAAELGTTEPVLREAVAAHLDHKAKVAAIGGPLLAMHARGDNLVLPENAEQLVAWAGDRGTLRLFDRGDHNSIHVYNGPAILDEVATFAGRG